MSDQQGVCLLSASSLSRFVPHAYLSVDSAPALILPVVVERGICGHSLRAMMHDQKQVTLFIHSFEGEGTSLQKGQQGTKQTRPTRAVRSSAQVHVANASVKSKPSLQLCHSSFRKGQHEANQINTADDLTRSFSPGLMRGRAK